jgi:periplasmic mercuric ion binding protein
MYPEFRLYNIERFLLPASTICATVYNYKFQLQNILKMKPTKIVALLVISVLLLQCSFAQSAVKKQTVKVYGNCGQCKKKIEKSAISAGAAYANWNVKTKMLKMSYDPSISNPIKIETAIANTGYDTQDVKASDDAYNKLDECCQYDRKSITSKRN